MRNRSLDISKGIGIILMVLGHTTYLPANISNFIYSFHMPLFFLISGMVYKRTDLSFKDFLWKKTKLLLIPYWSFCFTNLFLIYLVSLYPLDCLRIKNYIIGIIFCYKGFEYLPNCNPVWFLVCLFLSNILMFLLDRLKLSSYYMIGFLFIIGIFMSKTTYKLPWNLNVVPMSLFFMLIGKEFKLYNITNMGGKGTFFVQ